MNRIRAWVLTLLSLPGVGQAQGSTGALPPALEQGPPVPSLSERRSLARLDVTTLALLPRHGQGAEEGFAQVEPTLVLDGGAGFGLNLGAPVRLRLWGGGRGAGVLRKEDWDSLSDFGQVVRALKLGSDASSVGVWFGALEGYSLLSGHLVRRYSNRSNPDYHPAGGFLTGTAGPFHLEAFASDVLGARLVGAELEWGLEAGRYALALSAVHDWGRAAPGARWRAWGWTRRRRG